MNKSGLMFEFCVVDCGVVHMGEGGGGGGAEGIWGCTPCPPQGISAPPGSRVPLGEGRAEQAGPGQMGLSNGQGKGFKWAEQGRAWPGGAFKCSTLFCRAHLERRLDAVGHRHLMRRLAITCNQHAACR